MFTLFDTQLSCVAFDLEGTIVDLEFLHHQAHVHAAGLVGLLLNQNNLPYITSLLENFIGGPDETIAEQIYQHSNKTLLPHEILTLDRYFFKRLLQAKTKIEPREGFLEIYITFQSKGIPMTLGTLATRETADYILHKSGLDELFADSNIVYKEDITRYKPAPDIWYETARKVNADPKEQLVFDDAPKGIAAAVISQSVPIGMPVYDVQEIHNELYNAGSVRIYRNWSEINSMVVGNADGSHSHKYLQEYMDVLGKLDMKKIKSLQDKISGFQGTDKSVFICGNGGGAATSSHIACDLGMISSKNKSAKSRIRIISLNDNIPTMTALANDIGYDSIFAEQLKNFGRKGDLLIVLSGSGNSENIVSVVKTATKLGIETFGLLGFSGGKVKHLLDDFLIIPSTNYGFIENSYNLIDHLITDSLKGTYRNNN